MNSADDHPLVSVILVTRDRPRLFPLALRYFEYQTYQHRELIVVDDGDRYPADADLVKDVGGTLIRVEPGMPLGTKLNLGIEKARGSICHKMDDDDWYCPQFLEDMVAGTIGLQREVCRPMVAFLSSFLIFDVARWQIRHMRQMAESTLLFNRDFWEERKFRPVAADEGRWLVIDHQRLGALQAGVQALERFMAVRHQGLAGDRDHVWTTYGNHKLEDELLKLPLYHRRPEDLLPEFALVFYRELRHALPAAAAETAVSPIS